MSAAINLTGQRFGKLVVIGRSPKISKCRNIMWVCVCECGRMTEVPSNNLRFGKTKSCSCSSGEQHGMSKAPEYAIWCGMWTRCTNPNREDAKNYMGRGISVCDAWKSFSQFLTDMKPRPTSKHSIERINNDGNYEPSNCKWATYIEQANNRRRPLCA